MGPDAMGHALVLFLICYKASLQVTPAGGVVPAGGRVSLRCLCQVPCARLFLYRGMGPVPVQHAEAWGQAAEFPIDRAGPGDAGTYRCRVSAVKTSTAAVLALKRLQSEVDTRCIATDQPFNAERQTL
ncbi:hypothetical protein UY3_14104 [Chelonia mydas]|uniref:Immunoglobulin domain-containing protein n=1 Tax=Chelonia mydas TaxID=8469 RepID=M7ATV0_CHEMY|nr:hypothetical protein UY3_14104 [Chelonia mydas]